MRTYGLRREDLAPSPGGRQSLPFGGLDGGELWHEVSKVSPYNFGRGILSISK